MNQPDQIRIDHVDNDDWFLTEFQRFVDRPGVECLSHQSSDSAISAAAEVDDRQLLAYVAVIDSEGRQFAGHCRKSFPSARIVLVSNKVTPEKPVPDEFMQLSPDNSIEKSSDRWKSDFNDILYRIRGYDTMWLETISFGRHVYYFRRRVAALMRRAEGTTVVEVKAGSFESVASGSDSTKALDCLARAIHFEVQRLVTRPVVDLSESESARLVSLDEILDIERSLDSYPLVLQLRGKVVSTDPFQVEWEGDDQCDQVCLEESAAALAAIEVGGCFDAVVEVDRPSGRCVRVVSIEMPSPEIDRSEQGEVRISDLPEIEWSDI